ncbi:hypothetical protein BDV93DRAFT_505342 [Ceratobasidium sp. AG-I]|nr:hypothetical protein BDV93DRAFT_505342 [Ceratobasidium sp. AG-I]
MWLFCGAGHDRAGASKAAGGLYARKAWLGAQKISGMPSMDWTTYAVEQAIAPGWRPKDIDYSDRRSKTCSESSSLEATVSDTPRVIPSKTMLMLSEDVEVHASNVRDRDARPSLGYYTDVGQALMGCGRVPGRAERRRASYGCGHLSPQSVEAARGQGLTFAHIVGRVRADGRARSELGIAVLLDSTGLRKNKKIMDPQDQNIMRCEPYPPYNDDKSRLVLRPPTMVIYAPEFGFGGMRE